MSLKVQREMKSLAESMGLTVVEVEHAQAGHQKIRVQAPDGRQKCFTFGTSSSDHRVWLARKMDFRKFLRGIW